MNSEIIKFISGLDALKRVGFESVKMSFSATVPSETHARILADLPALHDVMRKMAIAANHAIECQIYTDGDEFEVTIYTCTDGTSFSYSDSRGEYRRFTFSGKQ